MHLYITCKHDHKSNFDVVYCSNQRINGTIDMWLNNTKCLFLFEYRLAYVICINDVKLTIQSDQLPIR